MITAIYCRLSKEDDDRHMESESIQNQKSLLVKYAVEKGWGIYNIYCDEDYSGIDRERPAFNRMLADAENRRFDIVLVKTQSRFTRDMELVEKYIHGKFLEWGIRFVATVDNIDTEVKGNKKARQISGLINEWYLEDLSENIRAVFDNKRKNGQYIGGFPLYGYQKAPDDKNKLVVEPEAAAVVRSIFSLYLAGKGTQNIAATLNAEGVPNPTKHKQELGCRYRNGFVINDYGLWNRTTISRILRDAMYTGNLVQGRTKKVSYKSKKMMSLPETEWIVVPDAHEAIIDKGTFATVQEMLAGRTTSSGTGDIHPLAGKVFCMDCGSVMHKAGNTYKGQRRNYLRCKLYATHRPLCTNHNIRLDLLESEVLCRLRAYIQRYYDADGLAACALTAGNEKKRDAQQKELQRLGNEVLQRSKALRALYLDKAKGLLDETQFMEFNASFLDEKKALEKRMALIQDELEGTADTETRMQILRERIAKLTRVETLTREFAVQFVDTIQVGQRDAATGEQQIKINWLF